MKYRKVFDKPPFDAGFLLSLFPESRLLTREQRDRERASRLSEARAATARALRRKR